MFGNKLFIVYSTIYYLHIIKDYRIFQKFQNTKILKFCRFGHCTIQINKKLNINLLVFTKVIKSVESVIAVHQST
jgi:hypothetical protein